jgi:hypothetical protein
MNKYNTWYNNLCDRGQTRITAEYTERHHIVPECFYTDRKRKGPAGWLDGDSNDPANITRLTDREHELAHYLLTKIYKDDKRAYFKMLKAYEMRSMVNTNQVDGRRHFNSRRLAGIRSARAILQSEAMKGEGNPMFGTKWTATKKQEHSDKLTGRKQTQEALDNLQTVLDKRKILGIERKGYSEEYKEERSKKYAGEGNPRYGVAVSDETRAKQRARALGRTQSEETIRKKADAIRGKTREKKLCPHCNQAVAVNGYARWHGANCKHQVK